MVCKNDRDIRWEYVVRTNAFTCLINSYLVVWNATRSRHAHINILTHDSQDEWYKVTFKSINYGINNLVITTGFTKWFPFNVVFNICRTSGHHRSANEWVKESEREMHGNEKLMSRQWHQWVSLNEHSKKNISLWTFLILLAPTNLPVTLVIWLQLSASLSLAHVSTAETRLPINLNSYIWCDFVLFCLPVHWLRCCRPYYYFILRLCLQDTNI